MPRFPVLPQRRSAPAAFSSTPRAQAVHFGAGIGRNLDQLGTEAVGLGQVVEQREDRQIKQQMSQFDLELAKQRAVSDAQAPPEETRDARIERHQSLFDAGAEKLLQGYQGQGLQGRLREDIEVRRGSWNRRLLAGEAQKRLGESLQDARGLIEHWAGRVAVDVNEFPAASRELLGDEVAGETGLLAGLGLRPEALAAWRGHALRQLLEAQIKSDPAGLRADLEAGRWQKDLPEDFQKSLLEDAEEALARHLVTEELERSQTRGGKTLALSQGIAAGTAGLADIRRAEEAGALSSTQAAVLRGEVEQAEIALQAQQIAGDELAISLSSGVGFDLGNPQNRQAADDFYEKTFSEAVREGASQEVLAQVVSAVARTGYLPPRLVRDTTGLLLGSDETRQVQGAELYGRLREAVPELIEPAIDLEARARGGVLKRWLDAGLEPADALRRAKVEFPRDGRFLVFDDQETAFLQRDLGSLFYGESPGHRVRPILDLLDTNYLGDLAQGLTPQQSQARARRDLGRVMHKLSIFRAALEARPGTFEQRGEDDHPMFLQVNSVVVPGPVPVPVPLPQADEQLSAAGALELERGLRNWAQRRNDEDYKESLENMEAIARLFPDIAASLFGFAMQSIGDGKNLLGKILHNNDQTNVRSVVIDHPVHGHMTIRQRYDISAEKHDNLDITFWDPDTREYVTEDLPSSRFVVQVEDTRDVRSVEPDPAFPDIIAPDENAATGDQTRVTPLDRHRPTVLPGRPSDPIPVPQLPPSEPGRGRELVPDHTGGNQTDLGPLTELAPGFPAQEQEPQIYVTPDQSDELNNLILLLSEEYEKNSTLTFGPYAGEPIPGYRERIRAAEQRLVNDAMKKHGCHTCGAPVSGTPSGNAIGDHQPPRALGKSKWFLPHCQECSRRQAGEVTQEKRRRMKETKKKGEK